MKRLFTNPSAQNHVFVPADTSANMLEITPASYAAGEASNKTSISERPHILNRRNARWSRRQVR